MLFPYKGRKDYGQIRKAVAGCSRNRPDFLTGLSVEQYPLTRPVGQEAAVFVD